MLFLDWISFYQHLALLYARSGHVTRQQAHGGAELWMQSQRPAEEPRPPPVPLPSGSQNL